MKRKKKKMRTKKSIYNFLSDVIPFILLGILNFLRIKYIIKFYGDDVNGYVQLITQIFSYLALAEAGFGTAVIYKLYKPLADNDYDKVSSIVVGSKIIFKKIALVMGLGSIICSVIVPIFINKGTLSLSFIVLMFLISFAHYLLEYFLVYPYTSLLQADQNQYVSNLYRNVTKIIFGFIELYLMSLRISLILIVGINILFTIVFIILVMRKIRKLYPWLNSNAKPDTTAFRMTKDVIVHKLSNLVFTKTDPIILSKYSLGYVSIYSAYNYILEFLTTIVSKLYNAIRASYCNIVALGQTEDKKYFKMFLSFSFLIATFCSITFLTTANIFVGKIWLDDKNVLKLSIVLLFSIIMYGRIVINPIYIARDSKGLYNETKLYTVIQAICNIILSLILVQKYEIFGVLLATIISQYLILIPCNVYVVYKNVFNEQIKNFFNKFLVSICTLTILYFLNTWSLELFSLNTKINAVFAMLFICIINGIISIIIYYCFDKDLKLLINVMLGKLRKKK